MLLLQVTLYFTLPPNQNDVGAEHSNCGSQEVMPIAANREANHVTPAPVLSLVTHV